MTDTPTSLPVTLALGGGAARGIGHIVVLEILDELGIRPAAIAGCSIGAIMGAGYASGLSGKDMRAITLNLFEKRLQLISLIWKVRGNRRQKRLFMADFDPLAVLEIVLGEAIPKRFSDLQIPFEAVATDYHTGNPVILREGDLHLAVAGSMAIPVVFTPVRSGAHLLIDGGVCNPLPFDLLPADTLRLAVDINERPRQMALDDKQFEMPSVRDMAVGAAQMTMQSIAREKLRHIQPDLLIRPPVARFMAFDFLKASDILAAVDAEREGIKRQIASLLE